MTRLATTPAILGILVGGMLAAGLAAGCGSNQVTIGSQNIDAAAGRGGAVAGGSGGSATGGVVGSGGVAPTGGTVGVGGATPSGGITGVGAGGSKASGGTIASGGSKAGGGTIATGGATGTGGTTTTCAGLSESCVTSSCCAPLVCGNTMGSPICLESYPPPATGGAGPGGGSPSKGGSTAAGGTTGTGGATGSSSVPQCMTKNGVTGWGMPGQDLICESNCAGCTAVCIHVGTRSEGWGFTCGAADVQIAAGCNSTDEIMFANCASGGAGGSGGTSGTGGSTGTGGTGGSTGKTCGGVAGVKCAAGEFCDLLAGSCNVSDATGTCVLNVGGGCIASVQPVCGCNGKTYNNDCERQVAGVSKQADGACPTADAGVIMTPTLPAACQVDGDCCVAVDTCTAMAYLVGRTEYQAMVASIPSISSGLETCLHCVPPAVQVRCNGGFCAGEKLSISSGALTTSHCGYISVSDAGTSTVSAHAAVDAGAAAGPSTWGCGL